MDLVWQAWTETERITLWFAPAANILAEEEGAYELFFDPSDHSHMSTIGCIITTIKPMEKLSFTWKGPDQFAHFMNEPIPVTSVEVFLREEEKGVRVLVKHTGWNNNKVWKEAREWHLKAWKDVLHSLKAGLESGGGLSAASAR